MDIFSVEEAIDLGLPSSDEEIDFLVEKCCADEEIYAGTFSGADNVSGQPYCYCVVHAFYSPVCAPLAKKRNDVVVCV